MGTRSLESISIQLTVSASVKNVLTDPTKSAVSNIGHTYRPTLSNGVQLNQANRAWGNSATIASAGTETIDLYDLAALDIGAGAGNDPVGQAMDMEELVLIMIENLSSSEGDLEIEPHGTNGWAPIGTHDSSNGGAIGPGGMLMKVNPNLDGFDIADASSHQLLLTAVGGDVNYKITVLGRHDDDESSSSSSSSSQSSSSSSSNSSSSSESSSLNSSSSSSST